MLTVNHLSINFDGDNLFSDVNLKFTEGNCYGVIGANGAGKSTFLRMLSGDLEPSTGTVELDPKLRMSVLRQDHFAFDDFTVVDTIIQGNPRLYEIMQEKMRCTQRTRLRKRTATAPLSWKRSLPSWTAGMQTQRQLVCCRVWDSRQMIFCTAA